MKKLLIIALLFICYFTFADSLTTGQSIAQDIDTTGKIISGAVETLPEGATVSQTISWVVTSVVAAIFALIGYFTAKYRGKKKEV